MENLRYDTPWRRMSAAIFEPPRDGKVFGSFDIDMTGVLAYIERARAEGRRVTPTHVVVASFGRALGRDVPELNCYARWGRVIHRGEVTVATTVSIKGRDLSVVKVRQTDQKPLRQVAAELEERVSRTREGQEDGRGDSTLLARIPWPLRRWIFRLLRFVVYEMGVPLKFAGLSNEMFGSVMITNVGSLGLAYAFPALMPASNLSFVVSIGKIVERPVVIDGQIVIRPMMPFGATFDHRVVDGAHIARLAERLVHYLTYPDELDQL